MTWWLFLALAPLAVYRATRLITTDDVTARARRELRWHFPPHSEPLYDAAGEPIDGTATLTPSWPVRLVECGWCVGFWLSAAATLAAKLGGVLPSWALAVMVWWALAGAVGLLVKLGD